MRRPTLGTTAAALAFGAFGFAAPTAVTMVGAATSQPAVLAQAADPGTTAANPCLLYTSDAADE